MISSNAIVTTNKDVVSAIIDNNVVLLKIDTRTYFSLNSVGAFVWSIIQTPYLASEICSRVIEEYDVSAEQCEPDILNLLQQLHEHALIQIVGETG